MVHSYINVLKMKTDTDVLSVLCEYCIHFKATLTENVIWLSLPCKSKTLKSELSPCCS